MSRIFKIKLKGGGFQEFVSKMTDDQAAGAMGLRVRLGVGDESLIGDFPRSLATAIMRFGSKGLSESQLAWVHWFANKFDVAERKAKREQQEKSEVAAAPAQVDGTKIREIFDAALKRGTRPMVYFSIEEGKEIKLYPAGNDSKNPGSLYLKHGPEYLGRVAPGGQLIPASGGLFESGLIEGLKEFCDDPKSYAVKYGRKTGRCAFCGRTLTTRVSIFNSFGPVCAEKFGLEHAVPPKDWVIPATAPTEVHGDVEP